MAIPILCVSRFQLLFAVGFVAVMYLMLYKNHMEDDRHRFNIDMRFSVCTSDSCKTA